MKFASGAVELVRWTLRTIAVDSRLRPQNLIRAGVAQGDEGEVIVTTENERRGPADLLLTYGAMRTR